MRLVSILLIVAFCIVVLAEERTHLERSEPIPVPVGWRRTSHLPLTQSKRQIQLLFAVKQRNLDILEETFWAVSDPKNPRYGKHLNLEQIKSLVGPSQKTVHTIVSWLRKNGCTDIKISPAREFITTTVSVPLASHLFKIEFHTYRHHNAFTVDTSVGPYSLPTEIAELVDLVTGPVGFPDVGRPMLQLGPKSDVGLDITPSVVRDRYNVSSTIIGTNSTNMHAVAEFQAQYYSPSDLKQFWKAYVPFAPLQAVAKVIGQNVPSSPGIEASLDVQYMMGVSPNVTMWFYSMKNFNFWNDLLAWQKEIAGEANPPYIHSVSYGSQGDYPSDAYRDRLNAEFQKTGARGISIIFASGDSGSGCESSETDDAACTCTFYPSFPATCPYVTTVGATKFLKGNTGAEGAVSYFGSGGGFSQHFPLQSFQSAAVEAYLKSGVKLPPSCAFNASGRSTPDVSALGDVHFQVVNGGSVISVGGTSASAPSFSAIMTLLNDLRLNAGKPVLGFLNPWVYQTFAANPTAFFDVTVGNNEVADCCRGGEMGGFLCAKGYDPATGVGTPNYAVLSTLM